jgi:hypothetical protein
MTTIDITGLGKAALLYRLWSGTITASFFESAGIQPAGFNMAAATTAAHKGYIDYFGGRPIKLDLSGDSVDPYLYDRDAGKGACASAVGDVRNISI